MITTADRLELLVNALAGGPYGVPALAKRLHWSEPLTRRVLAAARDQGSVAEIGVVRDGSRGRPITLWGLA